MSYFVFTRVYGAVWEPAEGGYYVETSTVQGVYEYDTLEAAKIVYDALVRAEEAEGYTLTEEAWSKVPYTYFKNSGTTTYYGEEEEDEREGVFAWARFGYDGYIGHGYSIELREEEPQNEHYEGYC